MPLINSMNKVLWGSLLIIVLLFVVSCTNTQTQPTCNSPYILVGTSCCLDANNNSICDGDEGLLTTTNNQLETERANIIDIGEKFGSYFRRNDYESTYEILLPELKEYKSKEEFVELTNKLYPDSGITSFILNKDNIFIEENKSEVNYKASYSGRYQDFTITFIKVEDKWWLDAYGEVLTLGCLKDSDCKTNQEYLMPYCNEECSGDNIQTASHLNNPFMCVHNLCSCSCYNNATNTLFYSDIQYG